MSARKKRAYAGVMILGGLAMVVDRFLLSDGAVGPAEAVASNLQAEPAAGAAPPVPIPELPFPQGLKPYDPRFPMRDLFLPPVHTQNKSSMPGPTHNLDSKKRTPDASRSNTAAFLTQHTLGGVLNHEGLRIAIVDGRWLRIGQSISGCTLAEISGNQALFECYDGTAALKCGNEELLFRD